MSARAVGSGQGKGRSCSNKFLRNTRSTVEWCTNNVTDSWQRFVMPVAALPSMAMVQSVFCGCPVPPVIKACME